MLREILAKFTGGQLTAIIMAAILVPGAVSAAVVFQPVAIVDPITDAKARVDPSRRLAVFDNIAAYRNNPANFVSIMVSHGGGRVCETAQQYVVPAGKALVITAMSGFEYQADASFVFTGVFLYDGPACTGSFLTAHVSSATAAAPFAPVAVELGTGLVVKAGKTLSVYTSNNFGYTALHGYLVPAAAAPAVAFNPQNPVTAKDAATRLKMF
jgi:hypothetical protein